MCLTDVPVCVHAMWWPKCAYNRFPFFPSWSCRLKTEFSGWMFLLVRSATIHTATSHSFITPPQYVSLVQYVHVTMYPDVQLRESCPFFFYQLYRLFVPNIFKTKHQSECFCFCWSFRVIPETLHDVEISVLCWPWDSLLFFKLKWVLTTFSCVIHVSDCRINLGPIRCLPDGGAESVINSGQISSLISKSFVPNMHKLPWASLLPANTYYCSILQPFIKVPPTTDISPKQLLQFQCTPCFLCIIELFGHVGHNCFINIFWPEFSRQ